MTSVAATLIANFISIYVIDLLFKSIHFYSSGAILVLAIVLGLVNIFIKPILKLLSLPLTILTFGIFSLVVNAIVLMIAFKFTPNAYIASFGTAFWASIVLSIVNSFVRQIFE